MTPSGRRSICSSSDGWGPISKAGPRQQCCCELFCIVTVRPADSCVLLGMLGCGRSRRSDGSQTCSLRVAWLGWCNAKRSSRVGARRNVFTASSLENCSATWLQEQDRSYAPGLPMRCSAPCWAPGSVLQVDGYHQR